MNDSTDIIIQKAQQQMEKALDHLENELTKVRAGKVSPELVDGIMVEYYGNPTPLNQVANIAVADARTLTLQPWEKAMIGPIEKAIMMANIGITPQNNGELIRLFLPPLTEERRRDLVKRVNTEAESGKVAVRNARREAIEQIKKIQKDGLSEDEAHDAEGRIQGLTDKKIASIDMLCQKKEQEMMTV